MELLRRGRERGIGEVELGAQLHAIPFYEKAWVSGLRRRFSRR